ncbi:hypothetical protein HZS_3623, partial [Henneguya salminicola]
MERKTEIMCRRVWEKVRENVEITCQTALCDFEKASINSFIGGQSTLYRDNVTASSIFKIFLAFAFIKEDNVIQAYEALEEHICLNGFEKQFRELLNYYEDTFIGSHHRTGRSQPLFPIRLWNQSERTENGKSQTNNKVEVRHNAFARLVGGNHPNILKFLASLKRKLSL